MFIMISILIQSLLLFCVCTHSFSNDYILVILVHLIHNVIGMFTHSCDYDFHFCGSSIGSEIVPAPHNVVFYGFYLDYFLLNIGHNFFNHGRLIIVSWPGIFSSVLFIFVFCFHFVHCIVCPVLFFLAWVIFPVIGVFTHISFIRIIIVTIHYCNNVW